MARSRFEQGISHRVYGAEASLVARVSQHWFMQTPLVYDSFYGLSAFGLMNWKGLKYHDDVYCISNNNLYYYCVML
jgi:hypothetical protein